MKNLTLNVAHIVVAAAVAVIGFFYLAPTSWWYEYQKIVPERPVYAIGDPLRLISSLIVRESGVQIEFRDQLRCLTDGGDSVIAVKVFPTALRGPEDIYRKVKWKWGFVPEGIPKEVPCYIRSVQKITLPFGIERLTEIDSETFTIVDFDYTKQQSG